MDVMYMMIEEYQNNIADKQSYQDYEYGYIQEDAERNYQQMLDNMIYDRIQQLYNVSQMNKENKIKELAKEIHNSCDNFSEEYIAEQIKILLGEDIND